ETVGNLQFPQRRHPRTGVRDILENRRMASVVSSGKAQASAIELSSTRLTVDPRRDRPSIPPNRMGRAWLLQPVGEYGEWLRAPPRGLACLSAEPAGRLPCRAA